MKQAEPTTRRSGKTKAPAFQFYAADFLSDGAVMEMTYEERGVYITLLATAWLEGGIPADQGRLARVLRMPAEKLAELWPAIESCWTKRGARLVNSRMERERQRLDEYRQRASEAGKKGGKASAVTRASKAKSKGRLDDRSSEKQALRTSSFMPLTSEEGSSEVSGKEYEESVVGQTLSPNGDVGEVFGAWLQSTDKDPRRTRLDPKRRRIIEKALASYPLSEVIEAVRGWQNLAHNRGENERGQAYNDLELLLRDAAHIERFRDAWRVAPQPTEPIHPADKFVMELLQG